jgi:adenylate cyclase
VNRHLAAILFYDVVGYSRAMGLDETATLGTLKANVTTVIQPLVQLHEGRIIKEMGDGGFIEFASSVGAVRFAIGMQIAIDDGNLGRPENQRLTYRIGINIGDVVTDGSDVYGDGVNVAARLEGTAEAGGICVHEAVRDQVRGKLDLDFQDLGEVDLKNIDVPVRAHNILLNEKADTVAAMPIEKTPPPAPKSRMRLVAAAIVVAMMALGSALSWQFGSPSVALASVERMSYPLPDKPSVAVLPFTNLSDDRSQDHFADGMTEDLITDLSRISGLFIVARNSTFVYKNQSVNIVQVAEDLGVRYVLEGSVRRAGDQVRVNAQLIDAMTGGHVWAERYDGPVVDIFAIQDQFIRKIAKALAVELTVEEQDEIALGQTANLSAREVFQNGWENYLNYTPEDNAMAATQFKTAIDLDPEYGRAYAALGLVYLRGCQQRWNKPLGVGVSEANAIAQNYLDETKTRPSSLANVAASRISLYNNLYDVAQSEAALAIAKDPNDPEGFVALAWAMITTGQPEAGLELMDRATRLNPRHPSYYILAIGMAHIAKDDLESAAKVFADALERDPGAIELAAVMAATYARLGRLDEAHAAMRVWKPEASQSELQAAPYKYHFPYEWSQGPEFVYNIIDGLHLAALPPGDQIDGLVASLAYGVKSQRIFAAKTLGRIGPKAAEAVPALINALKDEVMPVRQEAAIALGNIGAAAKVAIPALKAVSEDPIVGQHAQTAIKKIAGE